MKKTFQQGFTLIELLVVIAIIGILAAVVLGSLNDARSGGQDASIKQSVANIRAQAELVYNADGYSYLNVCSATSTKKLLDAAVKVVNGTAYVASTHGINSAVGANTILGPASGRTAACRSDETRYVAVSPLASVAEFWCVDSTGVSAQISAAPVANDYTCQ
ncbi:type II secretion system protein [Candidatus Nomurabacteria bacterium]|nr:type II secretion system protein [Candidatus Kaiserbacteria bacterium]MCB9814905.1 type II secretion system protein [Candidatus Nomurabacteria bacterium]